MFSGGGRRSVLVVSSTKKGVEFISGLLDTGEYFPVSYAKNGSDARRMLITNSYDLIIINAPLTDEFGEELAIHIVENAVSGVLLIVKSELFDEICYRVEEFGVFTVSKPLSKQYFYQALKLCTATVERLRVFEKEKVKLQVKIDEIRIIDRAKCTLIEYLKMSEAQAHRYIEKQAMDMRTTKKSIAESILRTYES